MAYYEDTEDLAGTLWKCRWGEANVLGHYLQSALADLVKGEFSAECATIVAHLSQLVRPLLAMAVSRIQASRFRQRSASVWQKTLVCSSQCSSIWMFLVPGSG